MNEDFEINEDQVLMAISVAGIVYVLVLSYLGVI